MREGLSEGAYKTVRAKTTAYAHSDKRLGATPFRDGDRAHTAHSIFQSTLFGERTREHQEREPGRRNARVCVAGYHITAVSPNSNSWDVQSTKQGEELQPLASLLSTDSSGFFCFVLFGDSVKERVVNGAFSQS